MEIYEILYSKFNIINEINKVVIISLSSSQTL